jgi:hypothetical protein
MRPAFGVLGQRRYQGLGEGRERPEVVDRRDSRSVLRCDPSRVARRGPSSLIKMLGRCERKLIYFLDLRNS